MNINDITIGEAANIARIFDGNNQPQENSHWEIGKVYLIRTVTHIQTGKLVAVFDAELVLENAAWIADTGRFTGALNSCDFSEVEPFPNGTRVIVGRGALIDAVQIEMAPRAQK